MLGKRILTVAVLAWALALLTAGCGGASYASTTTTTTPTPGGATGVHYKVALSGDQVVPPVTTSASGTAEFTVSDDGLSVAFELDVTDITDVTAAHIHMGAAGSEGSVVVPLFTGPQKPGSFTGILAKGNFTAAELAGPLKDKALADLLTAIAADDAYVNVHTAAHPGGEIRAQIK
jgi:hypothetical protein